VGEERRAVWAELPYPIPGGVTKTASTTKSTREAAERWLARMQEDAADAEPIITGSLSVGRYLDEWLRDAVEPFKSRRTYEKRVWAVNLQIKPALGSAGLPELPLHELRHTFASIMLHEWHVPPAVVSEAMRHADIAFTIRIYGHLIECTRANVMRRLGAEQSCSEAS
jgi:integrase